MMIKRQSHRSSDVMEISDNGLKRKDRWLNRALRVRKTEVYDHAPWVLQFNQKNLIFPIRATGHCDQIVSSSLATAMSGPMEEDIRNHISWNGAGSSVKACPVSSCLCWQWDGTSIAAWRLCNSRGRSRFSSCESSAVTGASGVTRSSSHGVEWTLLRRLRLRPVTMPSISIKGSAMPIPSSSETILTEGFAEDALSVTTLFVVEVSNTEVVWDIFVDVIIGSVAEVILIEVWVKTTDGVRSLTKVPMVDEIDSRGTSE